MSKDSNKRTETLMFVYQPVRPLPEPYHNAYMLTKDDPGCETAMLCELARRSNLCVDEGFKWPYCIDLDVEIDDHTRADSTIQWNYRHNRGSSGLRKIGGEIHPRHALVQVERVARDHLHKRGWLELNTIAPSNCYGYTWFHSCCGWKFDMIDALDACLLLQGIDTGYQTEEGPSNRHKIEHTWSGIPEYWPPKDASPNESSSSSPPPAEADAG